MEKPSCKVPCIPRAEAKAPREHIAREHSPSRAESPDQVYHRLLYFLSFIDELSFVPTRLRLDPEKFTRKQDDRGVSSSIKAHNFARLPRGTVLISCFSR